MDQPSVAIVDYCRTPFSRAGGSLADLTILDLSTTVVRELVERNRLDPGVVNSLILGSAMQYAAAYLSRETAIGLGWPQIPGYDVEYACATSLRAIANGALEIASGEADVVIGGGAESMSTVNATASRAARQIVNDHRFDSSEARLAALSHLSIMELAPRPAAITEPYTGKSLGQHAEEVIDEWGISREDADTLALRSHLNAAKAQDEGRFRDQIVPVLSDSTIVDSDSTVRRDTTIEKMAALPTVFDPHAGSVTAGNSSPLTDGASAVLLASGAACERYELAPRAWIRGWAFTGHDPKLGVLMGPAFALPRALDVAGLKLDDVNVVDFHEAFAGQVLANLAALGSEEFNLSVLGRDRPHGEIDPDGINLDGGSIALGHPFGATGGRLVGQVTDRLLRDEIRYGAVAVCAGGTRGAALVIERAA